ncbi:helix-turn-helix transcriptional regulator [Geodermatophilus sp. SYSU D00698]
MTTDRGQDAVYNRIALLRAEQGVTRRELADALGVHYQTVGYLERGEYNPSLHLALRIAEFFGLPVEVVFSTRPFPRISDAGRPAPGDPGGRASGTAAG